MHRRFVSWWPAIWLAAAGYVLFRNHGHYGRAHLHWPFFIVTLLCAFAALPRENRPVRDRPPSPLAATLLFFFCLLTARDLGLVHATAAPALESLRAGARWLPVAALVYLAGEWARLSPRIRFASLPTPLTFAAFLAWLQSRVPVVSPRPIIDVFVTTTIAVDAMLRGENPYSQVYPAVYPTGSEAGNYAQAFMYWPGILYWVAPFRALAGDIRYGYIAAEFLTAFGLWKLSGTRGALFGLIWLCFPTAFFVLEQAWTDSVLTFAAVVLAWSLKKRRWTAAGIILGAMFSVKQYAGLVALPTMLYARHGAGFSSARRLTVWAAIAWLLLVGAFGVADPTAFWNSTVGSFLTMTPRADALTIPAAWFNEQGVRLPGWIGVALLVGSLGWVGDRWRKLKDLDLSAWAEANFVLYGVFFVFAKQAFCNYYYYLAFWALLAWGLREGATRSRAT